jgi:hypothetical protein
LRSVRSFGGNERRAVARSVAMLTWFMVALAAAMALSALWNLIKRARGRKVVSGTGLPVPWQFDLMLLLLAAGIAAGALPILLTGDPFWIFGLVRRILGVH